jgi:hypothetical protein
MRNQVLRQRIRKRLTRLGLLARLEGAAGTARRLARRARRVCASTAGLSLVEVLVASAIIAIVSILLVVAFYTMGSVSMRASDITNADEELTSSIALTPGDSKTTKPGEITLGDTGITIPLTSNEYTTESGGSLWTFGYQGGPNTGG